MFSCFLHSPSPKTFLFIFMFLIVCVCVCFFFSYSNISVVSVTEALSFISCWELIHSGHLILTGTINFWSVIVCSEICKVTSNKKRYYEI